MLICICLTVYTTYIIFVLEFVIFDIYFVPTDDTVIRGRYIVVETVLTRAVVEIVLACRSEVVMTCGTDDYHESMFCN